MKLNARKVIIVNSRNEPAEENLQAVVGYLDKTRVKNLKQVNKEDQGKPNGFINDLTKNQQGSRSGILVNGFPIPYQQSKSKWETSFEYSLLCRPWALGWGGIGNQLYNTNSIFIGSLVNMVQSFIAGELNLLCFIVDYLLFSITKCRNYKSRMTSKQSLRVMQNQSFNHFRPLLHLNPRNLNLGLSNRHHQASNLQKTFIAQRHKRFTIDKLN